MFLKKISLAIAACFLALGFLNAQKSLSKQVAESFHKGNAREITLDRPLVLIRYSNEKRDANNLVIHLRSYYTLVSPHLSREEAIKQLNLPPSNKAIEVERVILPAGTKICIGDVAAGSWQKKGDQWVMTPNGRSTGHKQIYIPEETKAKITSVSTAWRNAVEQARYSSNTPPRPIKPSPHKTPPPTTPSNPAPTIKVRENTDRQHIQQTIKQQGDFPGGVIVQPSASVNISPTTVEYIGEEGLFLVDGRYRFHPMLSDAEIAQLAGLAFLSRDKRLAAVSQDQFSNVSPNSTIALALSDADKAMGWVAYGYNMEGFTLPDSLAAGGYVNPLLVEQAKLRHWWSNWGATFRIADKMLRGIEPRLFIEFQEIGFKANPKNNFLEASDFDIQINYQTFEYDSTGNKVLKEEDPTTFYPEIVAAIGNFRENWAWYEERFPELLKVRKIAETYALLKFMSEHNVALKGFDPLFEEYRNPLELPITYENYNDICPESQMVVGYAKALSALSWLPNWVINDEDELRLCHLRLNLAISAQDIPAIAKYRKQLATYLQGPTEDVDLREICKRLKNDLLYYAASGISAKNQFADRYKTDFPDLSRQYYDACIAYYETAIKEEPENYVAYDKLASIYTATGNKEQAKSCHHKMLSPLQKAADGGNTAALVSLGDLYDTGLADSEQPDKSKAFECYQNAADAGYIYAYARLANCYYQGEGVGMDKNKALEWYKNAAEAGISQGEFMVGLYCYKGLVDGAPDYQKAFEYFSKAADKGHSTAQFALGNLYYTGNAGEKDMDKSYFWFKRSADGGNEYAKREIQKFDTHELI